MTGVQSFKGLVDVQPMVAALDVDAPDVTEIETTDAPGATPVLAPDEPADDLTNPPPFVESVKVEETPPPSATISTEMRDGWPVESEAKPVAHMRKKALLPNMQIAEIDQSQLVAGGQQRLKVEHVGECFHGPTAHVAAEIAKAGLPIAHVQRLEAQG